MDLSLVKEKIAFSNNWQTEYEQNGSALEKCVRVETQDAPTAFHKSVGRPASAVIKSSRHADTPSMETPLNNRLVSLTTAQYGEKIDRQDALKLGADPTSWIVKSAAQSLANQVDSTIITAAFGNALGGADGTTQIAFGANTGADNMTVAVDYVASGTAAASNLTVVKLLQGAYLLKKRNPSIGKSKKIYFVGTPAQERSLLNSVQVGSADYNELRALFNGTVDSFAGINFVWVDEDTLPIDGNKVRSNLMFVEDGLLLAKGASFTGMDPLPGKSYSVQVYAEILCGATRMDENKVAKILSDEDIF